MLPRPDAIAGRRELMAAVHITFARATNGRQFTFDGLDLNDQRNRGQGGYSTSRFPIDPCKRSAKTITVVKPPDYGRSSGWH